jgi:hypothetical protein
LRERRELAGYGAQRQRNHHPDQDQQPRVAPAQRILRRPDQHHRHHAAPREHEDAGQHLDVAGDQSEPQHRHDHQDRVARSGAPAVRLQQGQGRQLAERRDAEDHPVAARHQRSNDRRDTRDDRADVEHRMVSRPIAVGGDQHRQNDADDRECEQPGPAVGAQ